MLAKNISISYHKVANVRIVFAAGIKIENYQIPYHYPLKIFYYRTDWPGLLSNHGFVLENSGFHNEDHIKKNRKGEYSYTVTPPRFGRNPCTISGNTDSFVE